MPIEKMKLNGKPHGNEKLPTAKDFVNPTHLTRDEQDSLDAFREAMKALRTEEQKYGKKTYL